MVERKKISQLPTLYKNNSGLIDKTKVSKYKKGLCLTEKLAFQNPLLFLYETVVNKQPLKAKRKPKLSVTNNV